MTPYQEAVSLLEKYKEAIVFNIPVYCDFKKDEWGWMETTKACAIIAVDLVIASEPSRHTLPDVTNIYYDEFKEAIRYWEEVKNEINQL